MRVQVRVLNCASDLRILGGNHWKVALNTLVQFEFSTKSRSEWNEFFEARFSNSDARVIPIYKSGEKSNADKRTVQTPQGGRIKQIENIHKMSETNLSFIEKPSSSGSRQTREVKDRSVV